MEIKQLHKVISKLRVLSETWQIRGYRLINFTFENIKELSALILNLITALRCHQDLQAFSAFTSNGKHVEYYTTKSFAFLITHHFMHVLFES